MEELSGEHFEWRKRRFVRAEATHGDNRGRTFTIAQPLADRYRIVRFFASGGMGLLLEGEDLRTGSRVLIKTILHYDVVPYARVRDRDGFTSQLRVPRKTLEMERRILVLLRNAGCNAVPHPNDFVFDANPQLIGPYQTDDGKDWTYDEQALICAEPYLIMEMIQGDSLEIVLSRQPERKLSEARSLRIMYQVTDVLRSLHEPTPMRTGMTWQLIYQDLKPANLLISEQDRATVLDLGGCQLLNLDTKQKLLPGACTAGYCPPECEQPYALLTPAADVYTVGANLYEMLSGRSPVDMVASSLGTDQARAVRLDANDLDGHCRAELKEVVERCVDWDPAKRYADAESLQKALRALMIST